MDKYEKEARVFPAIVGTIIPALLTTYFVEALEIWKSIALGIGWLIPVGLIYSALAYAFRQLAIDTSKMLFQFPLFKEDETEMPTTQLILWTSDKRVSEEEIRRIAERVEHDFGIHLFSRDEEIANLTEAKRTIVDAVGKIREVTRKNENLQQYNRKYGFCRNYLGACVWAILFIIVMLFVNFIKGMPYTHMLLWALVIQILLGVVDYVFYKYKAYDYARALFNAYMTANHE
jgi:hypothetical protein